MIDDLTIQLLEDPALDIPKARPLGNLVAFLAEANTRFFDVVRRFRGDIGELLDDRRYRMGELARSVVAAVELSIQGHSTRAWSVIEDILDEHLGTLRRMSLRHTAKVVGSRSWYRLTTWERARRRQDVFHLPFEQKAPAYRYSAVGRPALYLGNNVYACWLECNAPQPLSTCKVARFEIDAGAMEFLDLPANHDAYVRPLSSAHHLRDFTTVNPCRDQDSPYMADVEGELADYLSLWPLLMACSVQKCAGAVDPAPEYIASQLLAEWAIKQGYWIGVRYFTARFDEASGSNDVSINVVLPTRTTDKPQGFCNFLVERVRCTLPQSFEDIERVPDHDLFTRDAADRRQAAGGRYVVLWEDAYHHYQYTPFGRMEYWLDRDELPARRIDEP